MSTPLTLYKSLYTVYGPSIHSSAYQLLFISIGCFDWDLGTMPSIMKFSSWQLSFFFLFFLSSLLSLTIHVHKFIHTWKPKASLRCCLGRWHTVVTLRVSAPSVYHSILPHPSVICSFWGDLRPRLGSLPSPLSFGASSLRVLYCRSAKS